MRTAKCWLAAASLAMLITLAGGGLSTEIAYADDPAGTPVGDFIVTGGVQGVDYTYEQVTYTRTGRGNAESYAGTTPGKSLPIAGGAASTTIQTLVVRSSTPLVIANANPSAATADSIQVAPGVKADITLAGVNITSSLPFNIATNSTPSGNATIEYTGEDVADKTTVHLTLADGMSNTLKSVRYSLVVTGNYTEQFPGLRCGEGSVLVIDDEVRNVDVNGQPITPRQGRIPEGTVYRGTDGAEYAAAFNENDRLTLLDSANPGSLYVYGGIRSAAIGGGPIENSGDMTFNGGIIEARANDPGTNGAGCGIGGGHAGGSTETTFNGGTIRAYGSYHGAGVGGGCTYVGGMSRDGRCTFPLADAILGREPLHTIAGNININGGYLAAQGYTHGNAFGQGCSGTNTGKVITITGGTLLPTSVSGYYDVGGTGGDVVVTGGSVRTTASKFQSNAGAGYAYGGYNPDGSIDKTNKVMMTTIDLSGYGAIAKNSLVDIMDMKVGGVATDYGLPNRTDDAGKLYFWISNKNSGKEVSVELGVLNNATGETIPTEPFFITNVSSGSALKQYVKFEVTRDEVGADALDKVYDGVTFNSSGQASAIAALNIETSAPQGEHLTDASKMDIQQQLLEPDTLEPSNTSPIVSNASNVGKYQLIITSSQFSGSSSAFANAFWGHRAYLKYAEITPADTAAKVTIEYPDAADEGESSKEFTFKATVTPAPDEAKTCAAPTGKVQFYINGIAWGEPVDLAPVMSGTSEAVDANGFRHSEASITWTPATSEGLAPFPDGVIDANPQITARYVGMDSEDAPDAYATNYFETTSPETELKVVPVDVAPDPATGLAFQVHLKEGETDKGQVNSASTVVRQLDDGDFALVGKLVDAAGSTDTTCTFQIVDANGDPATSSVADVDPNTGLVHPKSNGTVYVKVKRAGDSLLNEVSEIIRIDILGAGGLIVREEPGMLPAFGYEDITVGNAVLDELDARNGNEAEAWAEQRAGELGKDFLGWTLDPNTNTLIGCNEKLPNGFTTVYPVFGTKGSQPDGSGTGTAPGDVEIGKTVENVTHPDSENKVGDVLHYAITAKNNALEWWRDVTVKDMLPPGVSLVMDSVALTVEQPGQEAVTRLLAPGEYQFDKRLNLITYVLPGGNIEKGATYTLEFDVVLTPDAPATGPIKNDASVVGPGGTGDPDSDVGVPSGGIADPVTPGDGTVSWYDPGFSSSKTAMNLTDAEGTHTQVGDRVSYELTMRNTVEHSLCENAVLYDRIPEGVQIDVESMVLTRPDGTKVQVPAQAYNEETRVLAVQAGPLMFGETVTLTFEAVVSDGALGKDIANVGYVFVGGENGPVVPGDPWPDEPSPDAVPSEPAWPLPGDEDGTGVIPSDPEGELTKEVENETHEEGYFIGDALTYRITLENPKPGSQWKNVFIFDYLPDGLELDVNSVELTHPSGLVEKVNGSKVYDKATHTLCVPIAVLNGGEKYVLTYRAGLCAPDKVGPVVNRAEAGGDGPDGPIDLKPEASVTVPQPRPVPVDPEPAPKPEPTPVDPEPAPKPEPNPTPSADPEPTPVVHPLDTSGEPKALVRTGDAVVPPVAVAMLGFAAVTVAVIARRRMRTARVD